MKISVIIHGPFFENAYKKIICSFSKFPKVYEHSVKLFICCYASEYDDTERIFKNFNLFPIEIIEVKDLVNPGFFNINRQIITVNAALSKIEDDSFVVKLRNDMWISWRKLLRTLEKRNFLSDEPKKILTTNCFTRKDRLYHPSDMFLCGWKIALWKYYSYPLTELTQITWQLSLLRKIKQTDLPFYKIMFSPENELFRHYLLLQNWDIKNTFDDSYESIKKYCCIINTWDIELRWNKKRNAFLPKGTIILPYNFSLEPFAGAPKENADCYARHDFEGRRTIKDIFFLLIARLVFDINYKKQCGIKAKSTRILKRIYHSRFFPDFLRIFYNKLKG